LAGLSRLAAFRIGDVALVFLLGKEAMGASRALAGTLLLTGVYYFSWPTPEFNQDVAQMPLWAGLALALWRATETDRWIWWLLLALFGAASLYAKLSSALNRLRSRRPRC
jgi:hypothetical protein